MCEAPYARGFQPVGVEIAVIFIKDPSTQGNGALRFEVPAYQTILSALNSLALQTSIGFPAKQSLIAVVNGTTADMTYLLQPGDTVQCFPQIAGG